MKRCYTTSYGLIVKNSPCDGTQQPWKYFINHCPISSRPSTKLPEALRSRNSLYEKNVLLRAANSQLQRNNPDHLREVRQAQEREDQHKQLRLRYQKENQELRQKLVRLPAELPLPNHSYGPGMIALCLNLAKKIGFRSTSTALRIVFKHLGMEVVRSLARGQAWFSGFSDVGSEATDFAFIEKPMSRQPRIQFACAIYLVTTRGDGRRRLFHDAFLLLTRCRGWPRDSSVPLSPSDWRLLEPKPCKR